MTDPAPILVPVDFSPASMAALQRAIALAESTDTTVVALHAFVLPAHLHRGVGSGLVEHLRIEARAAAARSLNVLAVAGLVAPLLREGQAAPEILAATLALQPSMIVMGSHGRSGADRMVLGSVAETVLRKATVPVMVVHDDQPQSSSTVLCAVGLDDDSRAALELSHRLARSIGGTVAVVHACATPFYVYPRFDARLAKQLEAEIQRAARRRLATLEQELGPFETHILPGKPGKVIVELAARLRPAAIVMATRGGGPVGRAFLGSVTEWVLRRSPFPVLSTHVDGAAQTALEYTRQSTCR